jgi:hypothetical protein
VRFITNLNDDIAGIFHDIVHVTHIVLPAKRMLVCFLYELAFTWEVGGCNKREGECLGCSMNRASCCLLIVGWESVVGAFLVIRPVQ